MLKILAVADPHNKYQLNKLMSPETLVDVPPVVLEFLHIWISYM